MKYVIISVFFAFFLIFFGLTSIVFAQSTLSTQVNVDVVPSSPGPNEQVTVTLTSFQTDLDKASITWKVNGKTVLSGRGQKKFTFNTGAMNTTTSLDIFITTSGGQSISKSLRFRPVDVDLMWQADSYTPPFYKGKAMFTFQDKITFIAVPHIFSGGVELSAKNLIYKWTENGSVVDYASGYGKNSFSFVSPLISRPINMEVEITSPTTNDIAHASLNIAATDPMIILYRKNPLYGIQFQNALNGKFDLNDSKEITIIGIPYFFGTKTLGSPDLDYKWAINGLPAGNNGSQEVFRQTGNQTGTSNISLSIENANKILELASTNFNLSFGQK